MNKIVTFIVIKYNLKVMITKETRTTLNIGRGL